LKNTSDFFFFILQDKKNRLFNAFSPICGNGLGTGQDEHVDKGHLLLSLQGSHALAGLWEAKPVKT